MVVMEYFETLTTNHTTYEAVKNFLTSQEGGRFRVVESGDYNGRYAIFRYVKSGTDMSVPHTRILRSVVWDRVTNKPVCVAPCKSENGSPPINSALHVEDYIDGVMVNMFIGHDGRPILATRTSLGATGTFYTKRSFHDMFLDAAATFGKSPQDLADVISEAGYSFASFVLQHPDHRIVARIRHPRLYLVSLGKVDGARITMDDHNFPILTSLHVNKYASQRFNEDGAEFLVQHLAASRGWTWQGIVCKNENGQRWRLRNSTYTMLRNLRGPEATHVERFLRLRKENKVRDYLQHYSEDRDAFWQLEQSMRSQTSNIFAAYRCVHKQHKMLFSELPKEYQPAVFRLHSKYLAAKKAGTPCKIDIKDVIEFVNSLETYEQMRILLARPFMTDDDMPPLIPIVQDVLPALL